MGSRMYSLSSRVAHSTAILQSIVLLILQPIIQPFYCSFGAPSVSILYEDPACRSEATCCMATTTALASAPTLIVTAFESEVDIAA